MADTGLPRSEAARPPAAAGGRPQGGAGAVSGRGKRRGALHDHRAGAADGRRDPGKLGRGRGLCRRHAGRRAAPGVARGRRYRRAVKSRPDAGIRGVESRLCRRRHGAGTAVCRRRPGDLWQAVFCHAPRRRLCGRAPHHPRSRARAGVAGDRRRARPPARPHSPDSPAPPRSRLSEPARYRRPRAPHRRLSPLSRSIRRAAAGAVLCHRDFRTGNYLVDGTQLTGILDWEFAGWSDPHEDIGWFCCRNWRFARLDREAGGIAARGSFYRGYAGESGRAIDPDRVRFWEAFASVRWAVIALQQCDRHRLHGERSLDLALTGRRAGECELALLLLLDPSGAPPEDRREPEPSPPAWDPLAADLPSPGDLLALARIVLIEELLPLLPAERHLDARLIANCLAIAARGSGPPAATEAILDDLRSLLETPVGADDRALLRRFACGLRIGAFENSPERSARARAILWRLTFARLRLANPRFLAANGFV